VAEPDTSLARAVAALPGGGEPRPGQVEMARAVATAITSGRHLIVQAGTGTGKSLAYLVPAIVSGRRTVVATATKALQDQLATKDLPFLQETLERDFSFAVLKGRSNYLCRQRLDERRGVGRLDLDELSPAITEEFGRLAAWAETTDTGDRSELDFEPSERAWQAASVTAAECPGAAKCPNGPTCFAEQARRAAEEADVIVVNLHLYGTHLASGGMVLPEHDIVIIDEAHQLQDTISATAGLELGPGRLAALARSARAVLADDDLTSALSRAGDALANALNSQRGERLTSPLEGPVADALDRGRQAANAVIGALRSINTDVAEADQRKVRAQKAATGLIDDIDGALGVPASAVAWVEGEATSIRLRIAPIDVGPVLESGLWEQHPTILTSATIPLTMPQQVGLEDNTFDVVDVGSPFDYETQAVLYCAAHLPDPRKPGFDEAVHTELAALIEAAGGRTLALFTSWRAMNVAVETLRPILTGRLGLRVLTQADLPKPALLAEFARDETSCLFATAGLFQGVDIPGRTLSLVTIDRIPFGRPDEPLLQARRDLAGAEAFRTVDLPRAATMLAQAAGRLIRSRDDHGVVAIFDPRLATAGYRWDIVKALPPMRRTRHRAEAEAFLRQLS
jgi:ATP-dependent DNA helicase DinG